MFVRAVSRHCLRAVFWSAAKVERAKYNEYVFCDVATFVSHPTAFVSRSARSRQASDLNEQKQNFIFGVLLSFLAEAKLPLAGYRFLFLGPRCSRGKQERETRRISGEFFLGNSGNTACPIIEAAGSSSEEEHDGRDRKDFRLAGDGDGHGEKDRSSLRRDETSRLRFHRRRWNDPVHFHSFRYRIAEVSRG